MAVRASVIIATYNRSRLLEKNLLHLLDQTVPQDMYEVVIVDDGSTDSTPETVKNFKQGNLIYLPIRHSGRAKAKNAGFPASSGEIIIFLDSDVIPCREFVEAHIKAHEANSKIICRGITVNVNNLDNVQKKPVIAFPTAASFPTGNCSVRREFLLESGLFDEDFTEYGWEDLELGHRLMSLGLGKKSAGSAVGFHCTAPLNPGNLQQVLQKERERGRMAVLYCKKSPLPRTRLSTMNVGIFFALEKLVNMKSWPNSPAAGRLMEISCKRRFMILFRLISRFKMISSYFTGMREAVKQSGGITGNA